MLAHGLALFELSRPSLRLGHSAAQDSRIIHVRQIPAIASPQSEQEPIDGAAALYGDSAGGEATSPRAPEGAARAPGPVDEQIAKDRSAPEEGDAFLDYLPRSKLSVAPAPLTAVDVPFPAEVSGIVNLTVQLTLFIDEQGRVRRVRIDSAAIPSAFAAAVLNTFLEARFKPGEVDNVAVRSRVRLEVEFRANRGT